MATEEQRFQILAESTKAVVEHGHHAISFSFWLNGAAATALFATGKTEFYLAAALMGCGAAAAVICMGLAYKYLLLLEDSWRDDLTEENGVVGFYSISWGTNTFVPLKKAMKKRFIPAGVWVLSILFFVAGICSAFQNFLEQCPVYRFTYQR